MARSSWFALVLVLAMVSGACGDSDDGGSDDDPVETVDDGGGQDAGNDDDGGEEPGEDDAGDEESGGEESGGEDPAGGGDASSIDPDDWVSQIMFASLGITPADLGVPQGDVDCMNAELVSLLPGGLPEDPGSVEAFQAFSDAADTCGATLG